MAVARAPNTHSTTVLDTLLISLEALDSRVYKRTATHVRAVGIALDTDAFDAAALLWADRQQVSGEAIIEAGYFEGEHDGVRFRVTHASRIEATREAT